MKIAIASGKGGVGKSMLSSALAMLMSEEKKILALDCDVDAPDMGIWLGHKGYDKKEPISTSVKARIDSKKCINCGKCSEVCEFGAIKSDGSRPKAEDYLCEGCGACEYFCPENAITLEEVQNGEIRFKETRHGFSLVTGLLLPGSTCSGKIVAEIKKRVKNEKYDVMVIDCPAGTGCPVIAAINDCDYIVMVCEPTPSAFSDLKRIQKSVSHFGIGHGIVINKCGLNPRMEKEIEKWAGNRLLGRLSFDKKVFKAVSELTPILESKSEVANEIKELFPKIKSKVLKK